MELCHEAILLQVQEYEARFPSDTHLDFVLLPPSKASLNRAAAYACWEAKGE